MTKEEILNKHDSSRKYIEQTCMPELFAAMEEYADIKVGEFISNQSSLTFSYKVPKRILDEYAKQQAIALLKYWNYVCVGYPPEDGDDIKFENTYNDFLQKINDENKNNRSIR